VLGHRQYVSFFEPVFLSWPLTNVQLHRTLAEYTGDVHWFCPACGDEDPSVFNNPDEPDEDCSVGEKHKRIKEAAIRIKLVFENCFILGAIETDFPEAAEWKTSFVAGLDRQLSRCYECVRAYHGGRSDYIAGLEQFVPYFRYTELSIANLLQ